MIDLLRRGLVALPLLSLAFVSPAPVLAAPQEGGAAPAPAPAPAAEPEFPGLPWKAAKHGKGRLDVLPGGLAVLHLAGTPEEMGEQHGTLLREPIRFLVEKYLPKILRGEREAALQQAKLLEKQIPERFGREAAALAKAAGISADDVLLASVVVELFGLNQCSGIAAFGPATADGAMVLGRNLEWPDHGMLGRYGLLVAARPAEGRPFLSVGFPAMTGVVTGMNADGLFSAELVVLGAPDREAALKGIPYPILQRRILEECRTLKDAKALVKGSPLTVRQNLFLAAPDDAVVLECAAGRCEERSPKDGLLVVTNHFDEQKTPSPFDPRYKEMCRIVDALPKGKVDAEVVERVTRGAAMSWLNLQCMVVRPGTLSVSLALGPPPACERPFVVLDGAALLGVEAPASRKVATPPADGGK